MTQTLRGPSAAGNMVTASLAPSGDHDTNEAPPGGVGTTVLPVPSGRVVKSWAPSAYAIRPFAAGPRSMTPPGCPAGRWTTSASGTMTPSASAPAIRPALILRWRVRRSWLRTHRSCESCGAWNRPCASRSACLMSDILSVDPLFESGSSSGGEHSDGGGADVENRGGFLRRIIQNVDEDDGCSLPRGQGPECLHDHVDLVHAGHLVATRARNRESPERH